MITRNTDYSIQRLRGLSTDTKPTDVPNGSEYREMDTGKKFLYSAAGTEWIEQPGSGGSGGGGSVEPLIVQLIVDGGNKRMDKTWQEIHDAMLSGVPAYVFAVGTDSVEMYPILQCLLTGKGYLVNWLNGSLVIATYSAITPNDYPTLVA